MTVMRLHHVGMAVEDLEKAVRHFKRLGFAVFMEFTKDSIGAKAVFLNKEESGIELWQFSNPNNTLSKIIGRHTAFESSKLEEDISRFTSAGYKIVIPVSEGTVVKRYAFVQDKMGNNIELVEPLDAK